jgi:hypothetical protein
VLCEFCELCESYELCKFFELCEFSDSELCEFSFKFMNDSKTANFSELKKIKALLPLA